MPFRRAFTVSVLFVSCLFAMAKDKKKVLLPVDILRAHTAWVIIDPNAGVDVQDPTANQQARADVEKALAKWGRITPVADAAQADLIIVVRKGNRRLVDPTIAGTPMNAPPPLIAQRTEGGISAAGRTGPGAGPGSGPGGTGRGLGPMDGPRPQMEAGSPDDTFLVYRGDPATNMDSNLGNPLDAPPVWRYSAKHALDSPSVPAVDQFRKVIAESEKALARP